jgi:hypothetical protein
MIPVWRPSNGRNGVNVPKGVRIAPHSARKVLVNGTSNQVARSNA